MNKIYGLLIMVISALGLYASMCIIFGSTTIDTIFFPAMAFGIAFGGLVYGMIVLLFDCFKYLVEKEHYQK